MMKEKMVKQLANDAGLTEQIASQFDLPGEPVGMVPMGSGNINDTFLAFYRTSYSETRCVIQRVNLRVFQKPEALMRNFRVVTEHVHRRIERERQFSDRLWQLPKIIATRSGEDFYVDAQGSHWRAITLIDSATAYDQAQGTEHAREAGAVLGQFHRLVADLGPSQLAVTIPGFHYMPGYFNSFSRISATPAARELIRQDSRVADLCLFVGERRELCLLLEAARRQGKLRLRVMHGDPKINNILIDRLTGRGTSIIDLDTVGIGLVHWDYGDAIRSICNQQGEDAPDPSRVELDVDLCRAFTAGYLAQTADLLDGEERAYLYDAIRVISFELGLRFLQDYLAGNVYFKTRYPEHNLHRAAVQFALCRSVERAETNLRNVIQQSSEGAWI